MLSYRFRKGVHVRSVEGDVVIATPYATRLNSVPQSLHIEQVSDSLRSLLEDLSGEGVDLERFVFAADASFADSDQLRLGATLEDFYLRGLVSTEISGCEGVAMSLNPVKSSLRLKDAPVANDCIRFSRLVRIQPCIDGLSVSTPLSAGVLHLKDQRLFQILPRLVSACDEEAIRSFLPVELRKRTETLVNGITQGAIGLR